MKIVKSVLLYGSESWVIDKSSWNRLKVFIWDALVIWRDVTLDFCLTTRGNTLLQPESWKIVDCLILKLTFWDDGQLYTGTYSLVQSYKNVWILRLFRQIRVTQPGGTKNNFQKAHNNIFRAHFVFSYNRINKLIINVLGRVSGCAWAIIYYIDYHFSGSIPVYLTSPL